SILQFCVDALKHRSELRTGEPLEFYLWFAYEFCLFTITCQAKHRLEFSNGGKITQRAKR
ncbi:hypothetical protein HMPREF9554_01559, partial [Treponema phagedenis F0421]